jgi:putative transposase
MPGEDSLEQTRQRYRFVVVGYVVMPEHIHLLITEPEIGNPSTVMQVLKQRSACALLPKKKRADPRQRYLFGDAGRSPFWQARFYDFNVWTTKKRVEKLRYMHRNPVKRGLVGAPEEWRWSSYRFYFLEESGPVRINEGWGKIRFELLPPDQGNWCKRLWFPPFANYAKNGAPTLSVTQARSKAGPPVPESKSVVPTLRKPRRVGQPILFVAQGWPAPKIKAGHPPLVPGLVSQHIHDIGI